MIGLDINRAKRLFFDSPKVMRGMDRAQRRVLSKFGAYVRRSAKSSIRKRKRASQPGSPPSSHTGRLKKFIFFLYEPQRRSVIIGPVLLGKGTDAPRLLEHGGSAVRRKRKKPVRITYAARPFMGPAMEREKPKLPAMWRDSVRA